MALTNCYCTLAELKAALGIDTLDTIDDLALEAAITSASRMIDDYTERFFYKDGSVGSPVARYFTPEDSWTLATDDIVSITEIAVDGSFDQTYGTVFATSDYLTEPVNNPRKGWPYTRVLASGSHIFPAFLPQSVRITGVWGWSAVPSTVNLATLIQASRLFARRQSPFGVAGAPDLGIVRLAAKVDADVEALLRVYRKNGGKAK